MYVAFHLPWKQTLDIHILTHLPFAFNSFQSFAWSLKLSEEIMFSPIIPNFPFPRYVLLFWNHPKLSEGFEFTNAVKNPGAIWSEKNTCNYNSRKSKEYPATSQWPMEAGARTRHFSSCIHLNNSLGSSSFFSHYLWEEFLAQTVEDYSCFHGEIRKTPK